MSYRPAWNEVRSVLALLPAAVETTGLGLKPQGQLSAFFLSHLLLPIGRSLFCLQNLTLYCPSLLPIQPPLCSQMNPVKRLLGAGHSSAQNPPMAPSHSRQKQKLLPCPKEGLPCRPLTCIGSKVPSQVFIYNFDF